ncbi:MULTISPECIES: winged helix-turn-helix domain-containing protein [Pseudomonas]|uniref:winged helix-turn-helix domain-containing protein n=1 Tax=Pseudomonas TaxID=286 RepID=UPI000B360F32|nr:MULTISPECIES: winged helix-turn-helix domain-containing protein [Pseudomonas]PMY35944.1 transcriptional regulator HilA [Pseudomonas sp. GW456-L14]PMY49513.1 transcriptional regulator HilA [Pseudomonas sp. GW456-L12]PMY59500.1 transcriptional regulator HilA [Pseudomonas sp. FW305-25]PMY60305.1 transcriptional regulator HilA [Pseudomonas sp. FW126-L8]PNA69211.1 transcriptional regulator HilA [Pseudomonas sp. FW305-76]
MEWVTDQSSNRSYAFGQWVLQGDGLLLHDGNGLHLPPKELHVLRLLLGAAGSLIPKDWLLEQVWPNCDVAEESLTRCIYALRKLLGRENDYIKTVYGKGYRFVGEVVERAALSSAPSSVPSLLVLPVLVQNDDCGLEMQCEMIRRLAAAFGESLCVMPAGLTANARASDDCLSIVERMMPDYYLSVRCIASVCCWALSVELVRGRDHALLHSETLVASGDREEVLQRLVSLVAQRLPGLRPMIAPCRSYPLAQSYLNGLLGLQTYTAKSLGEALLEFFHCVQLDPSYAPPWCGLADTYLAMANLGLMARYKALAQARQVLTQALALEPGNALATVRLALLTSLQGAPEAAEALFRPALMGGDRASAHYHYAWHQWCSGQPEQALQSIEISLAEDPASVAALLLRARVALGLDPRRGLAAIRSAIDVLGTGHEGIDAMHALILDVCGDSMAALGVIRHAGLSQVRRGEVGLVVCYVRAASDPVEARQHYERWRAASNYPPLCPVQLPVLRRLEGDFYVAPLWSEMRHKACPWLRAQLADPRLQGLADLAHERLQA